MLSRRRTNDTVRSSSNGGDSTSSLHVPSGSNASTSAQNNKTTLSNNNNGSSASSSKSHSRYHNSKRKGIIFLCLLLGFAVVHIVIRRNSKQSKNDDSSSSSLSLVVDDWSNRLLELYSTTTATATATATATTATTNTIPRFDVNSPNAIGRGSQEPVLLEGWKIPSSSSSSKQDHDHAHANADWTQQGLMQRVGHFPQYLKDLTVQPLKDAQGNMCVLPGYVVAQLLPHYDLLFFTNNQENAEFMKQVIKPISSSSSIPATSTSSIAPPPPPPLQHITGFQVLSAMSVDKSHSFHRHGESWLGQLEGRRQWWFLPPETSPPPPRVNACGYLNGASPLPPGATTILQEPGQIIWFPKDWYHATCALDDWTLGIGAQQGKTIRQVFEKLEKWGGTTTTTTTTNGKNDNTGKKIIMTTEQIQKTLRECLGEEATKVVNINEEAKKTIIQKASPPASSNTNTNSNNNAATSPAKKADGGDSEWKWFDGDLNAYYNSLEKDHNRDPNKLSDYAVHRWLGPKRSTEEHYRLLDEAVTRFLDPSLLAAGSAVQVLDGGCGLGSGLMWMEQQHPSWSLTGYTVSEEQYKFIDKLPTHKFHVYLQSYDELAEDSQYDFIYSIEALIHSPNATRTMEIWAKHLKPGGVMAILDDFVVGGPEEKQTQGMQEFAKSWLANSLFSTQELGDIGKQNGLEVVQDRDLIKEFNIIGLNYRNKVPEIHPFGGRVHQGWMGSKWRQRLTVEGKLTYNLLVMKKPSKAPNLDDIARTSRRISTLDEKDGDITCAAVPNREQEERAAQYTEITPQLMSGRGKDGGAKMACISGWYCCNKGTDWWDRLDKERTDNTAFLKLDRNLFGHYIDSFAKHLNAHYATHPESSTGGRFLDIGGTGSTASGMTQVTSKFQHFAGPLEYWKLDSDPAAKDLERTLYCDIEDCSSAETCGFDVTFSHTVLEHATRPWLAFDTVARITKKGGLTMHLVPFSYQYHATPDDNYRFSHKALISLLEDRGFEVLEVGYDICTKPNNMLRRVDEHYDTIWLTYVVGRKL